MFWWKKERPIKEKKYEYPREFALIFPLEHFERRGVEGEKLIRFNFRGFSKEFISNEIIESIAKFNLPVYDVTLGLKAKKKIIIPGGELG